MVLLREIQSEKETKKRKKDLSRVSSGLIYENQETGSAGVCGFSFSVEQRKGDFFHNASWGSSIFSPDRTSCMLIFPTVRCSLLLLLSPLPELPRRLHLHLKVQITEVCASWERDICSAQLLIVPWNQAEHFVSDRIGLKMPYGAIALISSLKPVTASPKHLGKNIFAWKRWFSAASRILFF